MALTSEQGVVLAGTDRRVPRLNGGSPSEIVDQFDSNHHHLVWSARTGIEIRAPRSSMVVSAPTGLWIPAGAPYTVEASAPWWSARFTTESCQRSWRRLIRVTIGDVVGPMLAHLHRHPNQRWSVEMLSAVVTHLEDNFLGHPVSLPFPTDPRAREVADAIVNDPSSQRDLHEV